MLFNLDMDVGWENLNHIQMSSVLMMVAKLLCVMGV